MFQLLMQALKQRLLDKTLSSSSPANRSAANKENRGVIAGSRPGGTPPQRRPEAPLDDTTADRINRSQTVGKYTQQKEHD